MLGYALESEHELMGLSWLPACRTELAAGQYQVTVLGYALESEYELTVELVERQRELRPEETLALGQVGV